MSKLIARLFVSSAIVAGGFLAVTSFGTAADPLPPVPTAATNVTVAANNQPQAEDLATWQETRIVVPTSNFKSKPGTPPRKR